MCILQEVSLVVELGSANRRLVSLNLVSMLVLGKIKDNCE